MLKNLSLFFFLLYPLSQFAQTADTVRSDGKINIHIQKISFDTIWNHTMVEADLILKVEFKRKYFMTFYGHYVFDVIEVVKGEFKQSSGRFELGLVDFSQDAYEKKYRALDSNFVYVGFKKITEENPSGYFMTDTLTGIKWDFWMSEIVDRKQRKVTEFDFCPRILLHLCCGISSEKLTSQKMVELNKKWAVEDSLFNLAEAKRCEALKDSLHLIRDFEKDSVIEGELIFLNQNDEDILYDSKEDYILDSLMNVIQPIDTRLDTSIHVNNDFEKDLSEFGTIIKPYTGNPPAWGEIHIFKYVPGDLEKWYQEDSAKNSKATFSFYPNPARDFITFDFKEIPSASEFTIIDVKGRKVRTEKITGPTQILDICVLNPGMYYIRISRPSGVVVKKLVVE